MDDWFDELFVELDALAVLEEEGIFVRVVDWSDEMKGLVDRYLK